MTIPVEQALEIGAPARLLDAEAGIDVAGIVIAKEVDLDQRERVRATLGAIPQTSGDAFAELAGREDERTGHIPPDQILLDGATGETLASWRSPTDPKRIDGSKIDGLHGSAFQPQSIGPEKWIPGSILGPKVAPGSVFPEHFSEEMLAFIAQEGGSQETIGYPDLDEPMQELMRKVEMLPEADRVLAADPEDGQLTPPIWDTSKHMPLVVTEHSPIAPNIGWPADVPLDDPKWMFGVRKPGVAEDHRHWWTFDAEDETATWEHPTDFSAVTTAEIVLPPRVVDVLSGGNEQLWSTIGDLLWGISITYRILEIENAHGFQKLNPEMGFGVSWRRLEWLQSPWNPPSSFVHTMGRGTAGKFCDVLPLTVPLASYTSPGQIRLGDLFGLRLQIQAKRVKITNPEIRLVSLSRDPEYRAAPYLDRPITPWVPTITVEGGA